MQPSSLEGPALDLLLSVGVRRLYTGPMTWTTLVLSAGSDEPRAASMRERLRTWPPFLAVGLSYGEL